MLPRISFDVRIYSRIPFPHHFARMCPLIVPSSNASFRFVHCVCSRDSTFSHFINLLNQFELERTIRFIDSVCTPNLCSLPIVQDQVSRSVHTQLKWPVGLTNQSIFFVLGIFCQRPIFLHDEIIENEIAIFLQSYFTRNCTKCIIVHRVQRFAAVQTITFV